jgi:hypothetical protein
VLKTVIKVWLPELGLNEEVSELVNGHLGQTMSVRDCIQNPVCSQKILVDVRKCKYLLLLDSFVKVVGNVPERKTMNKLP